VVSRNKNMNVTQWDSVTFAKFAERPMNKGIERIYIKNWA
jgi:hypothetical protein